MKKLILSLLIFCSVLLQAQIQIPQVVGLPAALAGKVDKATGKSLVADTLSAKIQPTAVAVTTKEPLLPSTPSNPESRFLNGNKQWAEIVLGSGGYASNVYFTNLTSTIVGTYKQTSGTHELTETIASGTCNNNEVLIHTYLFEQPVGITTVDAGVWRFTMNSKINSSVGDSKFKIVQFKRSSAGVETDMFTIYSNTIENTDYQNFIIETVQPSFLVDSLDRFGCRIYATTTTTVNKTISYKVGDGFASYLNTPLALRHPQLRDPNGNPNVQHLTAAQVTKVNNTSGINTGDETLTSIKTKLGAATSVSDGYLRYQDFALLHTPTTVTESNGLSISGQNISLQNASLSQSGALTFNDWNTFNSKEPAITKNTAFNKNFGTTPGTVLEGRTFGTAANSAVGDFQPTITGLSTNYIPKWNGSSFVNSLISDDINSIIIHGIPSSAATAIFLSGQGSAKQYKFIGQIDGISNTGFSLKDITNGVNSWYVNGNNDFVIPSTTNSTSPTTGALVISGGIGADHVRANNFYGSGSNLTGVQKPITLTTNGTSGAATFSGNVLNVPNYGGGATSGQYTPTLTNTANISSSSITSSIYTHIGNVYTLAIRGEITPAASGSCALRISIPAGMASATGSFVSSAISSNGSISHASWVSVGGLGTTYLTLIIEAPSTSPIAFSITGSYLHQ